MSTVRSVPLQALLTLALVAATAQAQTSEVSGSTRLQPASGSDEPDASGTAKFAGTVDVYPSGSWGGSWVLSAWFYGTLTVNCRGLTPFATYQINDAADFTADSNGGATLKLSAFSAFGTGSQWGRRASASFDVTVARVAEPDGTSADVRVLRGTIGVRVW